MDFGHANNVPEIEQVPAVPCDDEGYVRPLSAEDRWQRAYWKSCDRMFDPDEALELPRPRAEVARPPPEVVEIALAPIWSRVRGPCMDHRAKDRFVSELYPLPAGEVRDTRPPEQQVGAQARWFGRNPVEVYQQLHGDPWTNEGQRRVRRDPGYY